MRGVLLFVAVNVWGQTASLTSPDPRQRARAVYELRQSGARSDVLRTLVQMLDDPDASVRAAAADTLGEFGADAQTTVRTLLPFLRDSSENVRDRTARTLGRIGPGAAEAIPHLAPLLLDKSYIVRWAGLSGLAGIGPAAAGTRSAILAVWNDENEYVRGAAVEALSSVASQAQEAFPYLVAALRDPSVTVRRAAASGMSHWAASAALILPQLRQALADTDYTVQGAAMGALFRMPKRDAEGLIDDMIEVLDNAGNHFSVRAAAADFLGYMGEPARVAAPDLRNALLAQHEWVQRAAARALRQLGLPLDGTSQPRNSGSKGGVALEVRRAAQRAIQQIEQ